jgi:hypothetical protein
MSSGDWSGMNPQSKPTGREQGGDRVLTYDPARRYADNEREVTYLEVAGEALPARIYQPARCSDSARHGFARIPRGHGSPSVPAR